MADTLTQRTSPLIPKKTAYNQMSTLLTLNWESKPKEDNVLKTLGSCELFLEFCKGFPVSVNSWLNGWHYS